MGEILLKVLAVIALSSFKFIGGPPLAYSYKFSYLATIAFTAIGGMIGVVVVLYISTWVVKGWQLLVGLFSNGEDTYYAKPTSDMAGDIHFKYTYVPTKEHMRKQVFSPKSRRIVSIWLKYGLLGIAFVTPILLSIPAGTFIASRLERSKRRIFTGMLISILFWAFIITSIMFKVIPKPL